MKLVDKVKQTPSLMSQFSTPPVAVQRAAITADFTTIKYVRNPSQEIQCLAVEKGGLTAYKLISNPCYEAKKVLAKQQPMVISRNLKMDETLMEIAIRANTDSVATFHDIPIRLQRLARELAGAVEIINIIKNPHPDLVRDYLSEGNRVGSLAYLPNDIELEFLNNSKCFKDVLTRFRELRNPSLIAQSHYVKMLFAMAKREKETIPYDAWKKVSSRIDEALKYEIFESIDFSKMNLTLMANLRSIFRGCDPLTSALTLMS